MITGELLFNVGLVALCVIGVGIVAFVVIAAITGIALKKRLEGDYGLATRKSKQRG